MGGAGGPREDLNQCGQVFTLILDGGGIVSLLSIRVSSRSGSIKWMIQGLKSLS